MNKRSTIIITLSSIIIACNLYLFIAGLGVGSNIVTLVGALSIISMFLAVILVYIAEIKDGKDNILYQIAAYLYKPIRGRVLDEEGLRKDFQTTPPKIDFYSGANSRGRKWQIFALVIAITFTILVIFISFKSFLLK